MLTTPAGVTSLTVLLPIAVGDVKVAGGVEGQADGTRESGGKRADGSSGRHLAHRVVLGVGDVKVAAVKGQAVGLEKSGGELADHARGRYLAHRAIAGVGDVEIAGGVKGQSGGTVEPGGELADYARGRHFAHRTVFAVGDVEVAGGVKGHADGPLNPEAKVLTTPRASLCSQCHRRHWGRRGCRLSQRPGCRVDRTQRRR